MSQSANIPRLLLVTWLVPVCLIVSACADYRFTVNDRVVYTPEPLFAGYDVADAQLLACITQHIQDQTITAAGQLQELNCSHAGIADLRGLQVFTGLARVKLSHNAINVIPPLAALSQLSELYLDNNQLTTLGDLPRLPALRYLDVSGNKALACQEVTALARKPGLQIAAPAHC